MKIFISYRRSDSQDVVGRLYDHLERRLGTQAIFKDTGSIAIGSNFGERIRTTLQETAVMLVVIGPTWLSAQDKAYRRRIDDPTDWVRQEVELALATDARTVPVLVGDALMPEREHLPPSLAVLASLQAIRLRPDPDFSGDVERLCRGLGIPSEPRELSGRGRTKRIIRSPTLQRPLLVSTVRSDEAELELQYTLLFGSPAAAAPTARRIVPKKELALTLKVLRMARVQFPDLSRLGDDLAGLLLPPGFVDLLRFEEDTYLLVFHDRATAEVPWECVKFGDTFAAIAGGLSRRFISPLLSIPPLVLEHFARSPHVLIIADPSGDLPGAREEADSFAHAVVNSSPDVQLTMLSGAHATRESVTATLRQQSFDLIHYAGHAVFDETKPETGGLYLADRTLLTAIDITEAALTLPGLVFVSGAEAARISTESTMNTIGLAEAFLRCGVRDFIAPTWPVTDRSAVIFTTHFYSTLFRGATVGTALREGRLELWLNRDPDALNWVHFGLPDNAPVVREGNAQGAV